MSLSVGRIDDRYNTSNGCFYLNLGLFQAEVSSSLVTHVGFYPAASSSIVSKMHGGDRHAARRSLPWVDHQGDEILILKVDLAHNVVERRLAWPIHRVGDGPQVHAPDASRAAAHPNELGFPSLGNSSAEQRKSSLEKGKLADHVHFIVLSEVIKVGFRSKRMDLRDAGIGDHNV